VREAGAVHPLPALARFALGEAEIRETRNTPTADAGLQFEPT
jgi:hypothetical protein